MAADPEPKIEKHFDIAAMCAFWDKPELTLFINPGIYGSFTVYWPIWRGLNIWIACNGMDSLNICCVTFPSTPKCLQEGGAKI